jgi:hypothetical protein
LGQNFTVTAQNGQTYQLNYADTIPTGGPNEQPNGAIAVDIFDPNSQLTNGGNDNNFSTAVNGVPTVGGGGSAAGRGPTGVTLAVQTMNIQIIDPLLQSFKNAGAAWQATIQKAANDLFWILAGISLVFTGVWLLLKGGGLIEILAELAVTSFLRASSGGFFRTAPRLLTRSSIRWFRSAETPLAMEALSSRVSSLRCRCRFSIRLCNTSIS